MGIELEKNLSILYQEFIKLYDKILKENHIDTKNLQTFIDYSFLIKALKKEKEPLFNKIEYLLFDSKESEIEKMEHLLELYEKVKEMYNEK